MKKEPEIFEVLVDNKKIDELIKLLENLKENKEHEHFDDKNNNQIIFVHKKSKIM